MGTHEERSTVETGSSAGVGLEETLVEVTGVVFQSTPEHVLFAFELDTQVESGLAKPGEILIGGKHAIPASVQTQESLDRYVSFGCHLRCEVVREEGLPIFNYQTQNGEGDVTVELIQPGWRAR